MRENKPLSTATCFAVLIACCLAANTIPLERLFPSTDSLAVAVYFAMRLVMVFLFWELLVNRRERARAIKSAIVRRQVSA
jgi:hypothetical protein